METRYDCDLDLYIDPSNGCDLGALVAVNVRVGPTLVSAIQNLAASVVLAAAAGEFMPDIADRQSRRLSVALPELV